VYKNLSCDVFCPVSLSLGNKNLNLKGINLEAAYVDYALIGWLFS